MHVQVVAHGEIVEWIRTIYFYPEPPRFPEKSPTGNVSEERSTKQQQRDVEQQIRSCA